MRKHIRLRQTALEALCRRHHIRRLSLFGSMARGEARPDSDVDLLVEFEEGRAPSLGGMVALQEEFSRLFDGRKVDLATTSILRNPYRSARIRKELEQLYAA
jgi:hypothetical protein